MQQISTMSNTIIINGKVYNGKDTVVVRVDGYVSIDGKLVEAHPVDGIVSITINGDVTTMKVEAATQVTVNGSVNLLDVKAGNVTVDKVTGSLSTGAGKVNIGSIGNVTFE